LPKERELHDKTMRRLPHDTLPTHGKIADGANKRHDAEQNNKEKGKKMDKKMGMNRLTTKHSLTELI